METGLMGKRADGSAGESGRCASTAEAGRNSAGALSPVETRQVRNDETLRFDRVQWDSVVTGLRGATVRVEKRLDGSVAVRCQDRYSGGELCEAHAVEPVAVEAKPVPFVRKPAASRSNWNEKFDWKKAPPIGKAAQSSGPNRGGRLMRRDLA